MRKVFLGFSKRSYILLTVLVVCSVLLSLLSYYYSSSAAHQILELASEDIRSNAKIQAHDLRSMLSDALTSVSSNLDILSTSQEVIDPDENGNPLFNIVRTSSAGLSVEYLWLDQNGRILWPERSSNDYTDSISNLLREQFFSFGNERGGDHDGDISPQGDNPFFSNGTLDPLSGKMYSLMAYPVINQSSFALSSPPSNLHTGAVAAAIQFENDTSTKASLLRTQSSDEVKQNIVLVVDKGRVIFESNNNSLIGRPVSQYFKQIEISESVPEAGSDSLTEETLLNISQPTSWDVTFHDQAMSMISEPVYLDGDQVWTLYVLAPHLLTHDVNTLLELQNNFSSIMIILIGIVAFVIAMIILFWNKGLEDVVNQSTGDLRKMNSYLIAANEQLKIHDLMQKEFLNIASHEMKTPTQTILLHSNLLSIDPTSGHESIDAITRNAIRLQKLVNEILDITRIESKSLKLTTERLNLNQIVASIIEEYSSLIDSGKLLLKYDAKDGDIHVIGDKARITQVISNLVDNAIKFTKEGFIAINIRIMDGNFALVSITDTGSGIDPKVLPRIFDKFATNSDQGLGLGLYISKNIVEAHSGKMCAHNNNDLSNGCPFDKYHPHINKGATFSFTLRTDDDINQ
jgi:signal transduction histidine kinase